MRRSTAVVFTAMLAAAQQVAAPHIAMAQKPMPPAGHRAMPKLPGGNHGPCGSCIAPASLKSFTVIPEPGEPGEPLIVEGTIFEPDGVTPASGVGFFVYHTDATGHYNAWDDESDPRLHGWLRTDDRGRYEFRTIRPAPYAHQKIPAHIHGSYWSASCPEHWIDDYFFADDTLLSPEMRATASKPFAQVVDVRRDGAGVWHARRDIRLPHRCGTESAK